jgi:hypothetical protein
MYKKFISVFCMFFGILTAAHAGPAANVEYIHNAVREKWGIELTTSANPRTIANMEYLLATVDIVNERLNGRPIKKTEWKKYATGQVVDTIATDFAVSKLIGLEWPFEITTVETSGFSFSIQPAGIFYVDWGDGTVQKIERTNTTAKTYSHKYNVAGVYKIRLRGEATKYAGYNPKTISFTDCGKLAGIEGSLGRIFSKLSNGSRPKFINTFSGCKNLKSIPEDLFAGVSGVPSMNMFNGTFRNCTGLTSIPEKLFAGISGAPAERVFAETFYGCTGLTSIPENLFAEISGAPAPDMFDNTFWGCSSLALIPKKLFAGISGSPAKSMFSGTFKNCTGLTSIPENLFAGISGAPATSMFSDTFSGCSSLTSIPENLFGDISGPAASFMFDYMFFDCINLTGPSARINGKYLYEIWPDALASTSRGYIYSNCTGLTDYANIPSTWK